MSEPQQPAPAPDLSGPTAPEFYADAFTIAWSPFGVDLSFGRNYQEGVGLKEIRAVIAMSPQLAEEIGNQLAWIARTTAETKEVGPSNSPGPADIGNLS